MQVKLRITQSWIRYMLISSQTGRRNLANNLYKIGFPSISIMKITGHRSDKAFLKYIKVTPKQHVELLERHREKMFNGKI